MTINKYLTRRALLKNGLQTAAALYAHNLLAPSFALAEGGTAPSLGKTIVLLIKGGGQDMTFSAPPLTSVASKFAEVRPNIHIQPSSALDILDGNTGLHPNYAPLQKLISAGEMKLIQACGFENHSRSHEDASSHMSHGARHLQGFQATKGWPAKAKDHFDLDLFQLVGYTTGQRLELRSEKPGLVVGDRLDQFNYSNLLNSQGGVPRTKQAWDTLYEMLLKVRYAEGAKSRLTAKAALENVKNSIATVQEINSLTVGEYPLTQFGVRFRNIAKTMRWKQNQNNLQNSIYILYRGGYDTHVNQVTGLGNLITEEANALAAFRDDLVSAGLWSDTTVLSISEFSRTLRENSGRGTDHAGATTVFVLGGSVDGRGSKSVTGPNPSETDITRNYQGTEYYYTDLVKSTLRWWGATDQDVAKIIPEESPSSRTSLSLFR